MPDRKITLISLMTIWILSHQRWQRVGLPHLFGVFR
jgi:hypothetical protein